MASIEEHQREVEMHRLNAASCDQDRILQLARVSMVLRPRLSIDGNQWCALYGEDLQNGVAGFGDSPDAAMRAFDKAWHEKLAAQENQDHE